MTPEFEKKLDLLANYPSAISTAIQDAEDHRDLIDLAGVLSTVRSQAWSKQRIIQSELEDGEEGHRYRVIVGNTAKRSYNSSRLLHKFMAALDIELGPAIQYLLANDVISLSWKYQKLQQEARMLNIELTVAQGIIDDGHETADIGEDWGTTTPKYEIIEE